MLLGETSSGYFHYNGFHTSLNHLLQQICLFPPPQVGQADQPQPTTAEGGGEGRAGRVEMEMRRMEEGKEEKREGGREGGTNMCSTLILW